MTLPSRFRCQSRELFPRHCHKFPIVTTFIQGQLQNSKAAISNNERCRTNENAQFKIPCEAERKTNGANSKTKVQVPFCYRNGRAERLLPDAGSCAPARQRIKRTAEHHCLPEPDPRLVPAGQCATTGGH